MIKIVAVNSYCSFGGLDRPRSLLCKE